MATRLSGSSFWTLFTLVLTASPLVGAGARFTHQLEEPRYRRRRIEPVVEPVGVDDRRLPVVDVGQRR